MWFKHPKYKLAKQKFIQNFSASELTNLGNSLPKVLFICGGEEKYCSNRSLLEQYVKKHHRELVTFRAELAWGVISNLSNYSSVNALALEEWLADFSDIVIILVESYGTVAELGAFSLSPSLRKKLLPILDKQFESHKSFINTGPVMWVNSESKFTPSIYTDFSTILTCFPDINERLNRKVTPTATSVENKYGKYKYSPKVFLFFILYIISSLGPISIPELISLTSVLIDHKTNKDVSFFVSLGVALGLFKETKIDKTPFYTCVDFDKLFNHESLQKTLISIQKSRACALSDLIMISKFKTELFKVA